ncbi:epididymal-specific lipocalin-12 isoform X2 [Phacochoerus africanus]|uniref:epididymal-specific lipocalin-12 isoform X2 n=1 Tax=Phacochoerus africanus TaxID=41426 RepID=UPI001FD8CE73|nr:epididymal-specific lipocalin-12 isoform X2 [Phacochoerus africanus]
MIRHIRKREEALTRSRPPRKSPRLVDFRSKRCVTWSYVLISETQVGKFTVVHSGGSQADQEEVWVYDTDYASFALLLSRRNSGSQSILRVSLLCRAWAIKPQVLRRFVCLVQAQGLADHHIVFPDLSEHEEEPTQMPQPGEGRGAYCQWGSGDKGPMSDTTTPPGERTPQILTAASCNTKPSGSTRTPPHPPAGAASPLPSPPAPPPTSGPHGAPGREG